MLSIVPDASSFWLCTSYEFFGENVGQPTWNIMGDSYAVYRHVSTIDQHAAAPGTNYLIANCMALACRATQLETHADDITGRRHYHRGYFVGAYLRWADGKACSCQHVGTDVVFKIVGNLPHP